MKKHPHINKRAVRSENLRCADIPFQMVYRTLESDTVQLCQSSVLRCLCGANFRNISALPRRKIPKQGELHLYHRTMQHPRNRNENIPALRLRSKRRKDRKACGHLPPNRSRRTPVRTSGQRLYRVRPLYRIRHSPEIYGLLGLPEISPAIWGVHPPSIYSRLIIQYGRKSTQLHKKF